MRSQHQHESIGIIMKHQEVSESFRGCQEASERHNIKIMINNQKKNTVVLKPQVDSKKKQLKSPVR